MRYQRPTPTLAAVRQASPEGPSWRRLQSGGNEPGPSGRHPRTRSSPSAAGPRLLAVGEPLDVHIGTYSPDRWAEIEKYQADWPKDSPNRQVRPSIAVENLPWEGLGLVPRWVGDDTSQAVAAVEPSRFAGRGADELDRFLRGAQQRSEVGLVISTIGGLDYEPSPLRHMFGSDASVDFPHVDTFRVAGALIPLAQPPSPASGLNHADHDLALRIVTSRPKGLPWWALRIPLERRYTNEQPKRFFGSWIPLLVTQADETVAAIWTDEEPEDDSPPVMRCYVLPALDSYEPVLRWLADRAVPYYVPTGSRRMRRYAAEQPDLQTTAERTLHAGILELSSRYETQRSDLDQRLASEQARATAVRDPLLWESDNALVDAVARVITDTGATVSALDNVVGTRSADLLVELGPRRVLVEVKSGSGRAAESLTDVLRKHLRTWPQLRPNLPLDGAALVVNHQTRLPPGDRLRSVYDRPEFAESLEFPVISTVQLYDWWRRGDHGAIRDAFGLTDAPAVIADGAPATDGARSRFWDRFRERRGSRTID